MLRSVNQLLGYSAFALEDKAGHIDDVYFDERDWSLQFFIIDTGDLLPGKRVLVAPEHLRAINDEAQKLALDLSLDAVEQSPDIDTHPPVSRREENLQDSQTDSIPISRLGGGLFQEQTVGVRPDSTIEMIEAREKVDQQDHPIKARPTHLRSAKEVVGYYINASDGDIGHVEDLVLNEELWTIQHVVIDTRNWLPGKKVKIEPKWVESIDWDENKLYVSIPKSAIQNKPEYHLDNPG